MATATYDKLTRSDMSGFDKECIDLAMEAVDFGWTGKMSSKGHLILRAPDGTTTMSISRRWTNGRSGLNMRSNFDRWLRSERGDTISFEQFSTAWDIAEQERFIATMIDGITDAAGEFGGDDAERTKVIYRNILESPKVAPFAFRVGVTESRIKDFGIIIGYSDSIAEDDRRPWNVNWAVYDARSMEVIDHGGPRMLDGQPWNEETITLLVVEKIRREREEGEPVVAMIETATEEERPYVCEICGRTFKRPVNLGRHMSATHKDPLAFEGDPMEDGLDDLLNPIEPVAVQMDDHLTIVVDGHAEPTHPDAVEAKRVADAMGAAIDNLSAVAIRMALLESERAEYQQHIENLRREYEDVVHNLQSDVERLTAERDNAVASVSALKSLVADL